MAGVYLPYINGARTLCKKWITFLPMLLAY